MALRRPANVLESGLDPVWNVFAAAHGDGPRRGGVGGVKSALIPVLMTPVAALTMRMRALAVSATYKFPAPSTATPYG
jgi:hypothetical protein